MNEKEAYKKYTHELQSRTQAKAQINPEINQVLQVSKALHEAWLSCKGDTSLYRIKRAQVLEQQCLAINNWEQQYNATVLELQSQISRLETELLLANVDKEAYKNQLEMQGIKPVI